MNKSTTSTESNSSQMCNYVISHTNVAVSSTFSAVMAVVAIIGNMLVLIAIIKTPHLRTVTCLFVASLAVGDLYLNIVLVPMWIVKLDKNLWTLHNHPLQLAIEFFSLHMSTSVAYNLGIVSIDRLISIKCVYRYNEILSPRRCKMLILCVWLFSVIIAIPRLFVTDIKDVSGLFVIVSLVVLVIPYIVILYCYVRIYRIAKSQIRKISVNVFARFQTERNKKGSITIAFVIGIYTLLGLPVVVVAVVDYIKTLWDPCEATKMRVYWMWTLALSYSHSAYNPFIYAARNVLFNRAIRKILGLKSGRVRMMYATTVILNTNKQ